MFDFFEQCADNWEAEVGDAAANPDGSYRFNGTMLLSGDIDCAEGEIDVTADPSSSSVSGTILRSPCDSNGWQLTALDLGTKTAAGLWVQFNTSASGSFAGRRIAGQ